MVFGLCLLHDLEIDVRDLAPLSRELESPHKSASPLNLSYWFLPVARHLKVAYAGGGAFERNRALPVRGGRCHPRLIV